MNLFNLRCRTMAIAAAVTIGVTTAGAVQAQQSLTGAGSTFINPIMTQWVAAYQKETGVAINYQPVGSGAGINFLINHTVDFAGSDAPMNDMELGNAKAPVLHFPAVIGAVPVVYNIDGIRGGLRFSGSVLADIFLGKITKWNDPAIRSLNPGTALPDDQIFIVHRSDGSGTTAIFTDYLAKVSGDWKSSVGEGKSVQWPVGLGAKGSAGVAGILRTHHNSIGYVELAYAVQNVIPYALIQNAKGNYIYPSPESASAAADGVKVPKDFRTFFTNSPEAQGYPITGFSWLIVYKNSGKTAELSKFINWVLTTGQSYTKDLDYAAIPQSIRTKELSSLATLK